MRLALSTLAALLFILPSSGDEKDIDVYLLIGQSNMAGRAELSEVDREAIKGTFLLNSDNDWEVAKNPLNQFSTIRKNLEMQRMGPGYGFATAMRTLDPDQTIGLVVNAKGGTSLAEWQPGLDFFSDAVTRTKIALNAKGATLKGILWHQGEADVSNENYLKELSALVAELRRELDVGMVPFVAGQLFAPDNQPARIAFNKRLTAIQQFIPNSSYVSSKALTATDKAHFDSASMRLLGLRYAERMKTLQREQQ